MPRYKIKIRDEELARDMEVKRNVDGNVKAAAGARKIPVASVRTDTKFMNKLKKQIEKRTKKRPKGAVHAVAWTECPDGGANCRSCGDPLFVDQCAASGHCPYCGTLHGIAPESVVLANGYELEEIPD